jgi:hypothetical protein
VPADRPQPPPARPSHQHRRRARLVGHPGRGSGRRLGIERTGSVALVSGVIGALVTLIALAFSVGPLGHVERYLTANQPEHADTS